jgi:hypothetical protein
VKSQYRRNGFPTWWDERYRLRFKNKYVLVCGHYFRHPQTMNELRQLTGAEHDGEPVRRRRLTLPTSYDDGHIARNYGKSWKDYTKQRKQWDHR